MDKKVKPQDFQGTESAEEFFRKYDALVSEKSSINSLWQEIAEFCYPSMANFTRYVTNSSPDAVRQYRPIYDVTAEQSLDLCAASFLSLLCNPASKWLGFDAKENDLNNNYEVQIFLDRLQELCLSTFNDPKNKFYDNIFMTLKNIMAFGIGPVLTEEDAETVCKFRSEPPVNYMFDEDFQGNINNHYFEYEYSYEQLKYLAETKGWDIPHDLSKTDKHCVIRNIKLNNQHNDEMLGYKYAKYQGCYYLKQRKIKLFEDFFYESPLGVGRWDKINGTKWSDSPSRVALADVKMLNTTQRDMIEAIENILNPTLAVSSESQIGTMDISAKSVIMVQGDPRAAIAPVNTIGDVPSIFEWQQTLKQNIRTSYFVDIFMTAETTDMTATEANIRFQEKLRNIGPKVSRLQTDLLGPLIDRVAFLLIKQGKITPPEELIGQGLNIKYTTPVSTAYRQQEADNIMMFTNNLNNIAALEINVKGSSESVDNVDFDAVTRELADISGTKAKLLIPEDKVQEAREARNAQMEQQQTLDTAQQASEIAKNIPQQQGV